MSTDATLQVRRGVSLAEDEFTAVRELAQAIRQADASLIIFYSAARFDRERLGAALRQEFAGLPIIGCTTAGEITPSGYYNGSLTGVSLGSQRIRAVTTQIEIAPFDTAAGAAAVTSSLQRLSALGTPPQVGNTFGFLMIDGLAMQEEMVASCLHQRLHGIQLFGGSAGDDTRFGATFIYHEGRFQQNVALLTLVQTDLPFHIFRTQHFAASNNKLVVTGADPARRIVFEINGEPAGKEFAHAVGLNVTELTPLIFAAHPVVVRVGGDYFVRSIQKVNSDGSLTFFCAIDEGLVLTVARGQDMIANLEAAFAEVRQRVGAPELVLGCDCILRRLELEQRGIKDRAAAILASNNVVGFATYGEQFNAMHVNQTFTGVAIGRGGAGS